MESEVGQNSNGQLSLLPSGWKIQEVGNAFEICNNLRFPINETERKLKKGPFPYYGPTKIQDFIDEYRVEGKFALIGEDGDHFLKWKELPMTLLVEGKFNVNNHAHLIQGIENLTEWFYYYFQNRELTVHLTRQGAGRYKLTKQALRKIPIPVPPLSEQQAIVNLLSKWDDGIKNTQTLISQKEQQKKWLMQQLLTGKKRLTGFTGNWNKSSFENLFKVVKRNIEWDDQELYKLISVRRRSGGIFLRESLYGHQIMVKGLKNTETGDFLFSKMQILHGASALVTKEFSGAKISGSYIAVVPKDKGALSMEFFNWYSKTPYFYHQTYISSYGVHIEKMTFNFDSFIQLEMKLPPLTEQSAITQVLQTADKEIELLKAKLEQQKLQKKGLMQVLLTGKVRVNPEKVSSIS